MYENYPFWHTLLTQLGFNVVLSARSSRSVYMKGMETIPSESVCYPAKLMHGHVADLLQKGIKRIFYPCVPYENKEYEGSNNHYNCPIVTSYPEVIKNNVDGIKDIDYINPFFNFYARDIMPRRIYEEFSRFGVTKQ